MIATDYTVTWNDLVELKLMGLQLGEPRAFEDIEGNLVEIIYPAVEIDDVVVQRMKAIEKARRKPGLAKLLSDLWQKACACIGDIQRIADLGGGLGVDLYVGIDGTVRYQIFRERVSPSEHEWTTMLHFLPVPIEPIELKRFSHKGRQYIQAQLLLLAEPNE